MYGRAEAVTGEIAAKLKLRDSLFLATKVWTTGRDAGIKQMERSLELLGTKNVCAARRCRIGQRKLIANPGRNFS
jgi:diketogulonate reductase-like aldo/keto reductase